MWKTGNFLNTPIAINSNFIFTNQSCNRNKGGSNNSKINNDTQCRVTNYI